MLFNIRFILLLSLPIFINACVSHSPVPQDSTPTVINAGELAPNAEQENARQKESASQRSSQNPPLLHKQGKQNQHQLYLRTPRFAHASTTDGKLLYVFAGYGKQGYLSDVEIIDPQTGETTVLNNQVLPRGYFSAVFDQQHSIYLIGGISHQTDDVRVEQRIEVFDTLTHETRILGNIPEPLRDNQAVYLDGYIYVLGGTSYQAENGYQLIPSSSVWRYDIQQQKWQKLANMPSAKSTVVVTGNQDIYLIGGEQNTDSVASVERYKVANNEWQKLTDLPHPISAHSATWLNNAIWVFGNENESDNSYFLDTSAFQWQIAKLDYQSALYTSTTSIGDTIYVIGGNAGKGKSFMRNIQVFTP